MSAAIRFRLEPVGSTADLRREWSEFDEAGGTSFFTSWLWIGTWLRLLAGDAHPLLLRALQGERTVALAIMVRHQARRHRVVASRQLHFNATGDPRWDCLGLEHNGFAAKDAASPWRELLAWFGSDVADADELVIPGVAESAGEAAAFEISGSLHRLERVPSFAVDLAGDPIEALSRNSRQQLARAMRLCAEDGPLAIDEARDPEEALRFFEAMKPLHIAHWARRGKRHAFSQPFFETFHRALIVDGIASAAVELLRIRAGATPLGYLYNFRHERRVYAYQSGFDGMDRRRPGYVSHALAIRRAAQRGDQIYDFMAGANRLKESFASRRYGMDWHVVQKGHVRFRAENALRAAKRRLFDASGAGG